MVERRWEEISGGSAMESWRLPVLVYHGKSGRPGAYLPKFYTAFDQGNPGLSARKESVYLTALQVVGSRTIGAERG